MNYYLWLVKYRNPIVSGFVIFNSLLAVVWFFAFQTIVMGNGNPSWFYQNATFFGKTALLLYILTTIPGIFRRFGKFYKPVSILMIFRRYIGITTFMFILLHSSIVRFFFVLKGQVGIIPEEIFIFFGFLVFTVLFLLFITSNDWSVKKMGAWWHTIHNLTYIVGGLIFLHVALQQINLWSILIGLDTIALVASFIASRRRSTIL